MEGDCIGMDPTVGGADDSSDSIVAFLGRFGTPTAPAVESPPPDGATAGPAAADGDGEGGGFFNDEGGGLAACDI
jgi:hypothetical protein